MDGFKRTCVGEVLIIDYNVIAHKVKTPIVKVLLNDHAYSCSRSRSLSPAHGVAQSEFIIIHMGLSYSPLVHFCLVLKWLCFA